MACGSRNEAYNDFRTAVQNSGDDEVALLLVDSEAAVIKAHWQKPWDHLKKRDDWDKPPRARDDQAHLMVQVMESWFLADPQALAKFFGQGFQVSALPKESNIEKTPKQTVFQNLKQATRQTQKGEYGKGPHSFKILEEVSPQKVCAASNWTKRLIDELNKLL